MTSQGNEGFLCLADGTTFSGRLFGARSIAVGEVVFTTGMSGYQEVLTDPSYAGQLVAMTTPEIGNVGTNPEDDENRGARPMVAGFIVRKRSLVASNHRSTETLDAYLERHRIVAIADVDTRALVRHVRERGAQNGAIGFGSREELVEAARKAPSMEGLDLVDRVTPRETYTFDEPTPSAFRTLVAPPAQDRPHVVVMDLGIKRNILRSLVDVGFRVTVVGAGASAADILGMSPDGIFVSNGPGDPAAVPHVKRTVTDLLGKKPLFGICLGHQLLSLAVGAGTYKLKFGHRGLNQPVRDLTTGRVEITTQNHGFAVDAQNLPAGVRPTHVHLNDGTSEGIDVPDARAFSVQYHPEAAAGPHDTLNLFSRFRDLVAGDAGATSPQAHR